MADLAGIAASAAGGGLFGVFGTALGRVASYFEQRQSIAHEERRWSHEVELLTLQRAAAAQETEAELALSHAHGSWAGLEASLAAEAAIGDSYKWVNAARALTRPVLTVLLWGITAGIWVTADAIARTNIVETATFAATAATLWWFGDRSAGGRKLGS
ncbi:MAG: hypothetical protein AAFO74_09120 [Pseudomonadota bacterium]